MGQAPSKSPPPPKAEVLGKPTKSWPLSTKKIRKRREKVEQAVLGRLLEKKIEELSIVLAPPPGFLDEDLENPPLWNTDCWGSDGSVYHLYQYQCYKKELDEEDSPMPTSGWATAPQEEQSNLQGGEILRESIPTDEEAIKDLILRKPKCFGAIPSPGTCEKFGPNEP